MAFTKTQEYMLFSLGSWFEQATEKIASKRLRPTISKSILVDFMLCSSIVEKKKRAIYKNLVVLEKKKLVTYSNHELFLSKKGQKLFYEIKKKITPYLVLHEKIQKEDLLKHTKKIQTVFN